MQQENRMGKFEKLRDRILSGTSDSNIEFKQLCNLITRLGFAERVRGDHQYSATWFKSKGISSKANKKYNYQISFRGSKCRLNTK